MQEIVSRHWLELTRDYEVARFALELFDAQRRCMIRGSTNFVMVIWSFVVFEGLIRRLDHGSRFSGRRPGGLFPPCCVSVKSAECLSSTNQDSAPQKEPRGPVGYRSADISSKPAISLDAGRDSPSGLLRCAGAAYAMGAELRPDALFARFATPFRSIGDRLSFIIPVKRCLDVEPRRGRTRNCRRQKHGRPTRKRSARRRAPELLIRMVAARTELPDRFDPIVVPDVERSSFELHRGGRNNRGSLPRDGHRRAVFEPVRGCLH